MKSVTVLLASAVVTCMLTARANEATMQSPSMDLQHSLSKPGEPTNTPSELEITPVYGEIEGGTALECYRYGSVQPCGPGSCSCGCFSERELGPGPSGPGYYFQLADSIGWGTVDGTVNGLGVDVDGVRLSAGTLPIAAYYTHGFQFDGPSINWGPICNYDFSLIWSVGSDIGSAHGRLSKEIVTPVPETVTGVPFRFDITCAGLLYWGDTSGVCSGIFHGEGWALHVPAPLRAMYLLAGDQNRHVFLGTGVTIASSGLSSGVVMATNVPGATPGSIPIPSVWTLPRYWEVRTDIPEDQFSLQLDINYDPSEIPSSVQETDLALWRFDPTAQTWQQLPTTIDPLSHTATSPGLSKLGVFVVGPGVRSTLVATPSRGGNVGDVTVIIRGENLDPVAQVKLTAGGQPDVMAYSVSGSTGYDRLVATFDLRGQPAGTRDVVVTNPSGVAQVLHGGFEIVQGGSAHNWVDIIGPPVFRYGATPTVQDFGILYGNSGDLDSGRVAISVSFSPSLVGTLRNAPGLTSAGLTEEGDSVLSSVLPVITAGASGQMSLRLALPVPQDVYPHEASEIVAWSDDLPNEAVSSASNYCEFSQTLLDRLPWTRAEVDSPANESDDLDRRWPGIVECGFPDPCSGTVDECERRSRLLANGFTISNCPCLPSCDRDCEAPPPPYCRSGCTNVAGVNASTIDRLMELNAQVSCDLTLHGGSEIDGHTGGDCAHCRGYSVDVSGTCLSTFIYDEERGFQPGFTKDGLPTRRAPDGTLYIDETHTATPHWHVQFSDAKFAQGSRSRWTCDDARPKFFEFGTPWDPNDKTGSDGSGPARYVSEQQPMRYAISFENEPRASAAAQQVVVTDAIDVTALDLNTLSLGAIVFGEHVESPPPGSNEFTTNVDLRPGQNVIARVGANLDPATGVITWRFASIDPATGQPVTDPVAGFLPPNVSSPEGQGSVSFTLMAKPGLESGTEIHNQATIVFDDNAPIATSVWVNTLDSTAPSSHVLPLPGTQTTRNFQVQWAGTDPDSGVRNFTVLVSDNGSSFRPFVSDTVVTLSEFAGEPGHTYAFFSIAQDQAGTFEPSKSQAEAITGVNCDPGLCDDGNGCTDDSCDPASGCVHVYNTAPCDDANACTQSDTCQSGACVGSNPVTCSPLDQCHDAGECDPRTGICSNPAMADGSGCNDGNSCTQADSCQGGACVGSNPVVCQPLDQCHDTGLCDPGAGVCSNPSKADGTACSDENACTQTDSCEGGACLGSNPMTCTASDLCHVAGTCNLATGQCSNPTAPDGTPCGGGGVCRAGSCEPSGNQAPDCTRAAADYSFLWPPDHRFDAVRIKEVTVLGGGEVRITIIGIWQDEPLLSVGSGNTCPDGAGVGTEVASLRAEREGGGDGRVYYVSFLAADGTGATCTGTVTVCVPLDQGAGRNCGNQGPLVDSTGPCVARANPPLSPQRALR
ncbi:MAG: hypothetical protein LAO51_19030 [Acidobacteriia bacterium]|nr:hypothetical protein [Terriglobia bacterium]